MNIIKQIYQQIKGLLKAGLFTILPLTLTVIIVKFLYTTFYHLLAPFGWASIIMVFCGLMVIGFLGQFIISEAIIHPIERIIDQIPLIRAIYYGIKSILEFFNAADEAGNERRVVLIEYPKSGVYHIAFLLGSSDNDFSKVLPNRKGKEFVKVFMPTSHITTGYFFVLEKKQLVYTDLTFEEAVKTLVSGGLISPLSLSQLKTKD